MARLRQLGPALGHGFWCAREPTGSRVEVFVSEPRDIAGLKTRLARDDITVTVRAESMPKYLERLRMLAQRIRSTTPGPKTNERVYLYEPAFECPLVHIFIGARGHAAAPTVRWARTEERRYGADVVRAVYNLEGSVN